MRSNTEVQIGNSCVNCLPSTPFSLFRILVLIQFQEHEQLNENVIIGDKLMDVSSMVIGYHSIKLVVANCK